ncbi:MAG: hypothetical protein RL152_996 [Bacteroidota bacterium]|jgi:hypothetical protein
MKLACSTFLLFLLFASCNNQEEKEYFPFKSFLENELNQIDSLPIAIFKYTNRNNQTDTSIIEKKQFRDLAVSLLNIDLLESNTANAYKELVLEDTDIDNIAISYTTDEDQYPIKQLQLNIRPGTSLVKNVYVERIDQANEITILRKILWSTKKGVTVTSIYYKDKIAQEQLTEKYSWSIQ